MATRSSIKAYIWPAVMLIIAGALMRVARDFGWVHLPPNVAPVSALAMFGAARLPGRWSIILPWGVMLISDAIIGWYAWPVMLSVYASFGISWWLGRRLRKQESWRRIWGLSVVGSLAFFLITNGAVWAAGQWYPATLSGLVQAYAAGLPFLRNTVLGDLGYLTAFFGLSRLVVLYWERHRAPLIASNHGRV